METPEEKFAKELGEASKELQEAFSAFKIAAKSKEPEADDAGLKMAFMYMVMHMLQKLQE